MKFRCPKCRGGDFEIHEVFKTTDMITIKDGVVKSRKPGSVQATGKFTAKCDCGHRWSPRYDTGIGAVEAARDVEDEGYAEM